MGGADGSDLKEEGEGGAGGTGRAGQGPERLRRGGGSTKSARPRGAPLRPPALGGPLWGLWGSASPQQPRGWLQLMPRGSCHWVSPQGAALG